MILSRSPDIPGDLRKGIGYWRDLAREERLAKRKSLIGSLMYAAEHLTSGQLPDPRDFVDETWDNEGRALVARYVHPPVDLGRFGSQGVYATKIVCRFRGWSTCRICGCRNGSTAIGDDKYIWPAGFSHYIAEHAVKPPQEFIDHAIKRLKV